MPVLFNEIRYLLMPYQLLDVASQEILTLHLEKCFPGNGLVQHTHLPRIVLWGGWAGRFMTWVAHAQGVTFGRHVFWSPSAFPSFCLSNSALEQMDDFLVHEVTHVWQYTRDGVVRFLWRYIRDYYRHLVGKEKSWSRLARHRAYLAIPYEVEARWVETVWNERR